MGERDGSEEGEEERGGEEVVGAEGLRQGEGASEGVRMTTVRDWVVCCAAWCTASRCDDNGDDDEVARGRVTQCEMEGNDRTRNRSEGSWLMVAAAVTGSCAVRERSEGPLSEAVRAPRRPNSDEASDSSVTGDFLSLTLCRVRTSKTWLPSASPSTRSTAPSSASTTRTLCASPRQRSTPSPPHRDRTAPDARPSQSG